MDELGKSFEVLKLIKRVSKLMKQEFNKNMVDMNLKFTPPQSMVTGILVHHGPLKVSDLSERMNLSNSTVSGIVDRLEKMGYVKRIRSEEDRRVVMIDIVPELRETFKEKFKAIDEFLSQRIESSSEEEIEEILRGLHTLERVMSRHEGVETKK